VATSMQFVKTCRCSTLE